MRTASVLALCSWVLLVAVSYGKTERYQLVDWTEQLLNSDQVVSDASCGVQSVREANSKQIHGILQELLNTTFFRLFRVPAEGDCPLKQKPEKKKKRKSESSANAHEEVEEEETCGGGHSGPLAASGIFGPQSSALKPPKTACEVETTDEEVDVTITKKEDEAILSTPSECDDENDPAFWLNMCSNIPTTTTEYINLQLNPEHYTGYNGSKIWKAIYSESCFKGEEPEDMCYEERVLYRLLSGLHTSINTHISLHYEAPRREGEPWKPNPDRFVRLVGSHPERVNNLHFAYVVLLRAIKKVEPTLRNYDYSMGIKNDDIDTGALVEHLLDTHVLRSCKNVFEAFDESLMFQEEHLPTVVSLKRNFKNVFHNISDIFNCVKCQRCRLHGKMQLLGVGTALKVLLLPEKFISLSRDEVVALFNTLGKLSEALVAIPQLVEMYWESMQKEKKNTVLGETKLVDVAPNITYSDANGISTLLEKKKTALAATAKAGAVGAGLIEQSDEDMLVDAILDASENDDVLLLAEYYGHDIEAFTRHALRRVGVRTLLREDSNRFDVIVVGGGLAGLTTTLTLLDRGARVAIVDKESFLGGNSAKASSGINGIDGHSAERNDSVLEFTKDVLRGGGRSENDPNSLVRTLTEGSVDGLDWLRTRCGLPLEKIGQLGGHSHPRTHRPAKGLAGAELVNAVQSLLDDYVAKNKLVIMKKTKVIKVLRNDFKSNVTGVICQNLESMENKTLNGDNIVLATGGFAYDTSEHSLLQQFNPSLTKFATTNGKFATGDGISLVLDVAIKGKIVDMSSVQLHPTGFIDTADVRAKVKKLCAELLRGVGGILLDPAGKRFVNELGTRDYISNKMLERQPGVEQPSFTLLLNGDAAQKANVHVPMYTKRKLLYRFDTVQQVAAWLNISDTILRSTLEEYDSAAELGVADKFGKVKFPNTPLSDNGPYYVGKVTPVLHYCMGGIEINENGQVIQDNGDIIPGLYAAGEVTGGVHGKNRLGGNALTECIVFGRRVGLSIDVPSDNHIDNSNVVTSNLNDASLKKLSADELAQHSSKNDCWVQIHSLVYELSDFIDEHPGNPESILELCGLDGTEEFEEIHNVDMLKSFNVVGELV